VCAQTMFGKIASLLLAVPSGLPIGPEGPLVHIGACIASFFSRQHNLDIKIRGRTLLKLTCESFSFLSSAVSACGSSALC
jgi:H+/Cl- antiporter ClcA